MKRTILPHDFVPYYPVGIYPCEMYVDVANRIYDRIKNFSIDLPYEHKLKKEIAINVAIYYEDKMSNIGLWNAFTSRHQLIYDRPLPFFDNFDKLYKDEVNAKEVELLIWLIITRNFSDRFINPLVIGEGVANLIMEVLTEDDQVEINDGLYEYIYTDKAHDYFKLKHILMWLRRSYLLSSPLSENRFNQILKNYSIPYNESLSKYYAETIFSMSSEIGPLALEPHICLADMYNENNMPDEAQTIINIKYCQPDTFKVLDTMPGYVILNNSKDEKYKVINDHPELYHTGSYLHTALVKYGDNEWEVNGFILDSDERIFVKMSERNKELEVAYKEIFPLYMKRTNGKRMAFFENKEQLKEWLIKISPEVDTKEALEHLPNSSQVAFISQKAGIIFAPGIIHAIKCKDNPYYKKCDDCVMQQETIDALINTGAVHPELLNYLLENKMLQDGDVSSMFQSKLGKQIFTQNIDFIARHYRRYLYYDHDY